MLVIFVVDGTLYLVPLVAYQLFEWRQYISTLPDIWNWWSGAMKYKDRYTPRVDVWWDQSTCICTICRSIGSGGQQTALAIDEYLKSTNILEKTATIKKNNTPIIMLFLFSHKSNPKKYNYHSHLDIPYIYTKNKNFTLFGAQSRGSDSTHPLMYGWLVGCFQVQQLSASSTVFWTCCCGFFFQRNYHRLIDESFGKFINTSQ